LIKNCLGVYSGWGKNMSQPSIEKSGGGRHVRSIWVLAIIFALLIIWMMYTASQSYVVESNSGSMPGMDQSSSETSSTQMPDTMPGMNH